MKYNTIEIEERRARNEALIAAAANEGNGNGMNMFMGMNLGQTLGGQLSQQVQNQAPAQNAGQATSKNFTSKSMENTSSLPKTKMEISYQSTNQAPLTFE